MFFETTYLILVTLQVVTGVRSVPSRGKFYPGYRLLWRTREKCKGGGGGLEEDQEQKTMDRSFTL